MNHTIHPYRYDRAPHFVKRNAHDRQTDRRHASPRRDLPSSRLIARIPVPTVIPATLADHRAVTSNGPGRTANTEVKAATCAAGAVAGIPRISTADSLLSRRLPTSRPENAGILAPTRMPAIQNSHAVSNTKDVP
jgi:hypothetical protein